MARDIISRNNKKKKSKKVWLMFCEGETEVEYFQELRVDCNEIMQINIKKLSNKSFTTIAEEMVKFKEREENRAGKYDAAYCVFDYNNLQYHDYQKGCKLMKENGIDLIFTNQSFEVWLLMHFVRFERQVKDQGEYEKELQKYLPGMRKPYVKSFEILRAKLPIAIVNAKTVGNKLLKEHGDTFHCEPYTDVWKIFDQLEVLGFKY